ncbi:MAG: DNA-processing protein DprA [Oscillospiraceae bacterium]
MDEYNIWLSYAMGSNCVNAQQIISLGFSPKEIYENRKRLIDYDVFTKKQMEKALSTKLETALVISQKHRERGIISINYTDETYPTRFVGVSKAPLVLYCKGNISLLQSEKTVGSIGTRHPDRDGEAICQGIVRPLAQSGVVIVSGLAQGLDGASHRACLAVGGKTVAFVGVPLDRCYPADNRGLQEEIFAKGLVVSEYPMDWYFRSPFFLERNRLIAALSDVISIVQAKAHSGTLATAKIAMELNKPVFVAPGRVMDEIYEGTNLLLSRGEARVVINSKDILNELKIKETKTTVAKAETSKLSQSEQRIYGCFKGGAMSTAQLIEESGFSSAELKRTLTLLEMEGLIKMQSLGVYKKVK